MARSPAIRPIPRTLPVAAILAGLLAGATPRLAAAEPVSESPAGPTEASAREADRAPQLDAYPPPAARTRLLIAGPASTAAWYGAALAASYAWPDTVGANDLRIPVAGPWIALSHSGCGNVSDCSKVLVVLRAIATTLDAIGQAGGLALTAEGLFLPTREPKPARSSSQALDLRPTFDAGKNSVGFGVLGVF